KNEMAFVCNKGHSCIRTIKGVHSFQAVKFVGTLKTHPLPVNWKPEGLTVVSKNTLEISKGNTIHLVCMDCTFTGGQLVSVLDNLESPRALFISDTGTPETLLVADGKTIKAINLNTKTVEVAARGFKQAFDKEADGKYKVQSTIGTGNAGCSDGPASKAQLSEPTGLSFDFDSVIFWCFGGSKNGYIKLYSAVDFACRFMDAIRQIYHAIGFLPKKEQNYLAKGVAESVKSLQGHIQSFKRLGMQDILAHLNLYAFVNEARKEHGFAKRKLKGQYRHPTLQQYVHTFQDLMKELQVQRGENPLLPSEIDRVQAGDYLFLAGDIVAINPGTEDKWWLVQVNKPHHSSKYRSGCHVFGFWLAEEDTIDMSVSGKDYSLLTQSVKTYFGTIIKDNNNVPLVIPVDELKSGWQNGQVVYAFTEEYCRTLDFISDSLRKGRHAADNNEEDGASDLEADEDDGQPPDIHEVELMAMQRRRRVVRDVEGQIFSSYRDL
ncbi:Hypothetical predicted protein, partial [Paramuricea clavata]